MDQADWIAVANEVKAALAEVGFQTQLKPRAARPTDPWTAGGSAPAPVNVIVVDQGIRILREAESTQTRRARMALIEATGVIPEIDDLLNLRGVDHAILAVMPVAPGGVDLLFRLELSL